MQNKPLITFAVVTFNQERFVRKAVEGALAQTYSPLEILLSDDHSSDETWTILRQMAAAYRGPHQIVLNRNPVNLGIGAHVNKVLSLANGELLVGAAGDDISIPKRTDVVFQAWENSGRKATAITSSVRKIDEHEAQIGQIDAHIDQRSNDLLHRARHGCRNVHGCSQAWHRRVFETFGPLQDYVVAEDRAMEFRCWALGPVVAITEYLVQYRVHGSNVSAVAAAASEEQKKRAYTSNLKVEHAMHRQFLADLDRLESLKLHSPREIQLARQAIVRNLGANLMEQKYVEASLLSQLALGLGAAITINPRTGIRWVRRSLHLY